MAIKINKYHDLSLEELNKELQNKKDALFNMRFQKTLQQLDHPIAIRNIKKDIARIKTQINFLNNER
jgi:large subunit ribosomal protein L29